MSIEVVMDPFCVHEEWTRGLIVQWHKKQPETVV